MSFPLIVLLLIGAGAAFWFSSRAAAEAAVTYGRQACKHAGVQWLDQSVHQVRLRLARDSTGQLRWERQYRFEYSNAGDDRHAGLITLRGTALAALVGPMPATPASPALDPAGSASAIT